jgi:hypothetical protein
MSLFDQQLIVLCFSSFDYLLAIMVKQSAKNLEFHQRVKSMEEHSSLYSFKGLIKQDAK